MSTTCNSNVIITSLFDEAFLSQLSIFLKNYTKVFVITDQTVAKLYGNLLHVVLKKNEVETVTVSFSPGEKIKSLVNAYHCWTQMQQRQFDRRSCVLAIGGGVVTDLAGFVAACFMRGVDVIHIPTTLMGMIDASIGGKTAINTEKGKNVIGCFHFPKKIYICLELLKTLPERDYRSGLAEVIKYGIVKDRTLFEELKTHLTSVLNKDSFLLLKIISRCCDLKNAIIKEDFLDEKDHRCILNFGHTFAHALEVATQYYLTHGEAVAIGIHLANIVGHHLGITPLKCVSEVKELILNFGFFLRMPISIDELLHLMIQDKKCIGGKINLIIAENIGNVIKIQNVKERQIREALSELGKF